MHQASSQVGNVGRMITSRTLRHIARPPVALRLRHIPFGHFVARRPAQHVVRHLTRTAKIFISRRDHPHEFTKRRMTNLAKRSALGLRFSRVGTCDSRDRSGLRAHQRDLGVGRAPGGRLQADGQPVRGRAGHDDDSKATTTTATPASDARRRRRSGDQLERRERRGRGRQSTTKPETRRVGRVGAARPRLPGRGRDRRPPQGGPAPRLPQEAPLRAVGAGRLLRFRRAVVDLQLRRRGRLLPVGGLRPRVARHPHADAVSPGAGVHVVRPADPLFAERRLARDRSRCSGRPSTRSSSSATRRSSTAICSRSPAPGAPSTPACSGLTWEAGVGAKLYFNRFFSFRLDLRDFLLPQEVLGRGRITNNVTILAGLSLWLG